MREGQLEDGLISVGQGMGLIEKITGAGEVIEAIVQEAQERWSALGRMF